MIVYEYWRGGDFLWKALLVVLLMEVYFRVFGALNALKSTYALSIIERSMLNDMENERG